MSTIVYLSLGSNMGDRLANLQKGQALLANHPQIQIQTVSSYYQTSPVGGVVQDDFINQAMRVQTQLGAEELLDYIHEIEAELLRKRVIVWGPRTLDIDILFYGDQVSDDPDLTLPHPEIYNRLFVLVPLLEVLADDFPDRDQIQMAIDQIQVQTQQSIEKIESVGN